MIVYVDLLFLINFVIDFALFYLTARVRRLGVRVRKLMLASLLGAGYVLLYIFPQLSFTYTLGVKAAVSVLLVAVAFGFKPLGFLFKNVMAFYFVSFGLGGGLFALQYLLNDRYQKLSGILDIGNPFLAGTSLLFIGFPILFWFSRQMYRAIGDKNRMSVFLVQVEISIEERKATLVGLIDTGNHLYEPMTRRPVMIAEALLLPLPDSFKQRITQGLDVEAIGRVVDELPGQWRQRVAIVPYRSANKGMDLMVTVRPDLVEIIHNGKSVEVQHVLIGLDPGRLSHDNTYQVIVHPDLIQEKAGA
jgi:stage II sporulation protein GA (sporulation sigma-E factor processing peptidase)